MATLSSLEEYIQTCRRCESTLSKYDVEPRPIFSGGIGYPIFLLESVDYQASQMTAATRATKEANRWASLS